jgi:hypothetical protein
MAGVDTPPMGDDMKKESAPNSQWEEIKLNTQVTHLLHDGLDHSKNPYQQHHNHKRSKIPGH